MTTRPATAFTCEPHPPITEDDVLAFWLSVMLHQPCSARHVRALRGALRDYGFNIVPVGNVAQLPQRGG